MNDLNGCVDTLFGNHLFELFDPNTCQSLSNPLTFVNVYVEMDRQLNENPLQCISVRAV